MSTWKSLEEAGRSASMEEIELEAQHRAKWNSYCDSCREPLAGGEVWIRAIGGSVNGAPSETYYCPECVAVGPVK